MDSKLFFRVVHPEGKGLWYNKDGEFTQEIVKLDISCANLEMNHDEECTGGFSSCTDSLDSLFDWFGREELFKLKENGYDICIFNSEEYKFHEKHKHFLFKTEGSLLVAKINII